MTDVTGGSKKRSKSGQKISSNYVNQDTLNESFLNELSARSGIESLEKIYFSESFCALYEHWKDMANRADEELGINSEWLGHLKEKIANNNAMYNVYGIDDADGKINEMEHFLTEYCQKQNPNMQYSSKASYASEYEGTPRTYKIVGVVVSVLLALIYMLLTFAFTCTS